jgi:hypothetical protein
LLKCNLAKFRKIVKGGIDKNVRMVMAIMGAGLPFKTEMKQLETTGNTISHAF